MGSARQCKRMKFYRTRSIFAVCFAVMICLGNSSDAEEVIIPAIKGTVNLILNYGEGREAGQVCIRQQDEVWLVSARCSHPCSKDLTRLSVSQLANGSWTQSDLSELVMSHQTDQSRSTVLHVHGWRADHTTSVRQTMDIYKNVTTKRPCTKPLRWVLWQWRSDKDNLRFRTDYIEKSKLALSLGTTLSATLAEFGDRNLTLIGHSLGNTVILAAMMKPTTLPVTDSGYRLAIVGAAIGCDFVKCLAQHQNCMVAQIDETVVINNLCDPVLRVGNQLICRQSYGRKRLDLANIVSQRRIALGNVCWREAHDEIGPRHDGKFYTASNTFLSEFSRLLNTTTR